MEDNEKIQQADSAADQERDSQAPAPAPRGNPEPDQESVDRGKEQLDKISGN